MVGQKKSIDEMNYFELLAWLGIGSSHPGGFPNTKQYLGLLQIKKEDLVLEAGCGTGNTACYLAKTYNCKVIGTDVNPEMIERAKARAEREGLAHLVEFKVADVYRLPFNGGTFDVVLAESLTVFLDKQRVYREFFRVLKPGGRLADLEMSAVKEITPEVESQMHECFGRGTDPLSFEGWVKVLEKVGFEYTGILNPQYLKPGSPLIVQELRQDWVFIKELTSKIKEPGLLARLKRNADFNHNNQGYFGYGVICGRKPQGNPLFNRVRRALPWS